MVQQQALRDFGQAIENFFAGTHGRPGFRKAGRDEGFRWSRPVPLGVRSYRVTCDRAGRRHIAFAAVPAPIPAPGTGAVVGVDRGITVSAALSTGERLRVPVLPAGRAERLVRLQRRLARAKRGSNRRAKIKAAVARLKVREADARKDCVEKVSANADVNAAMNIAAGRVVTARGGAGLPEPANREPQLFASQ